MPRIHLFEIADQPWCPRMLRDALTDYLNAAIDAGQVYHAAAPLLARALDGGGDIVDLCAGGGGPWRSLLPALAEQGARPAVRLTDVHPNVDAFARMAADTGGVVTGDARPIDARRVPADLRGVRTLFSAFHHLRPDDARAVLRDAAERGEGIAVFEGTRRSGKALVLTLLVPLMVLLLVPRIRPFRWSRVVLTYLVPVLPLVALFDGLVSCLRTYTVDELRALVAPLERAGYAWEVGEAGAGPIPITYLVGRRAVVGAYIPDARAAQLHGAVDLPR